MKIRIGHTPDADDAFMFYGFHVPGALQLDGLEIEHVLEPMQHLNRRSLQGELEMTAFSFATFAQASRSYRPMTVGISLGHGYGPMIVSTDHDLQAIRSQPMASPGDLTTAHLLGTLWNPEQRFTPVAFDQTLTCIKEGRSRSALCIHEGQMQLREQGLQCAVDLGEWWAQQTGGLPIPLGLNGVRRDLPESVQQQLTQALYDSVRLALENVDAATAHALPWARGLDHDRCRAFILRYVNRSTLQPGPQGFEAVAQLCARAGLEVPLDWLTPLEDGNLEHLAPPGLHT